MTLTVEGYVRMPLVPPDERVAYGADAAQFGDLYLPERAAKHPVVVVLHGGCWRPEYGLGPLGSFCRAVAGETGAAVWSLEYRRVGERGGGWPGTFLDVAAGFDHLASIARDSRLDLSRVVTVGHSAGGQLALWLAARPRVPVGSPVRSRPRVRPVHAIGLAAITDLEAGARLGICGSAIAELVGAALPEERMAAASPARLLPFGIPQTLVAGTRDAIVPVTEARAYAEAARSAGDDLRLVEIEGAGHFDLVDPRAPCWALVRDAIAGAF